MERSFELVPFDAEMFGLEISSDAVRRAAAELQLAEGRGVVLFDPPPCGPIDSVVAARHVEADADEVRAGLEAFFERRSMAMVRIRPTAGLWRPSQVGRGSARRMPATVLRDAEQVAAVVVRAELGGGTIVRLQADLRRPRPSVSVVRRQAVLGAGVAAAVVLPVVVAAAGLVALAGSGPVGAAALGGAGRSVRRASLDAARLRSDVAVELEGLLDRIELGRDLT